MRCPGLPLRDEAGANFRTNLALSASEVLLGFSGGDLALLSFSEPFTALLSCDECNIEQIAFKRQV